MKAYSEALLHDTIGKLTEKGRTADDKAMARLLASGLGEAMTRWLHAEIRAGNEVVPVFEAILRFTTSALATVFAVADPTKVEAQEFTVTASERFVDHIYAQMAASFPAKASRKRKAKL